MRILVFSWREIGNPHSGGAERVTFQHMRHWVASGHQVTLFTAKYPGADARSDLEGIQVIRHGGERTVHLAAQHWYRRQCARPDVIIDEIHGIPFGAIAYAGVPVVGWIHEVARDIWRRTYPFPIAATGWLLEAAMLRWYAQSGVPFMTVSRSTAADLVAIGVAPANLEVVESAIDRVPLREPPQKERDPTLVVVGRLIRLKGIGDALRAFAQVRRQFPRCRLWIVGAGAPEYVGELRRLAGQFGLDTSVQFLGRVSEDEKYSLLARAHVLIHASQREGWGLNVMEANAMGTPSVAYGVPGLRDSVRHGVTGILCPRGQPAALASAICSLLTSPDRYAMMQRNALQWSAQFTWEASSARSLALLSDLSDPRRKGYVRQPRHYGGRRLQA